MDFVFVSLQRINTDRDSTSTSLAKELSKNHRVLYVNSPIDRRTYYFNKADRYNNAHIQAIKNKEAKVVKSANNLWVLHPSRVIESINWIPFTPLFTLFNRINNKRFAKDIKEAIDELGFQNFTIINDKDIFRSFYLKEILNPAKYIYLDRDYTVGMPYWEKHGVSLEPRLMEKSDAVVCNSYGFTKRAKKYNPNSHYIGNGFDSKQYNNHDIREVPTDLKNIKQPRIGYIGGLVTLRLDLALMVEIAKLKPLWNFVFIGSEDEDFKKSELHKMPNVHFLGRKHTADIPAYIDHLDVCINPQILNEITESNFPLKILEYLALGKPVVATTTSTMEEVFVDHVYLAEGITAFISKIQQALEEDNENLKRNRIQFSKNFCWENVAATLLKVI